MTRHSRSAPVSAPPGTPPEGATHLFEMECLEVRWARLRKTYANGSLKICTWTCGQGTAIGWVEYGRRVGADEVTVL